MFLKRKFLGQEASGDNVQDIVENLRSVLTTKRECGHFLPEFGLTETGYRTGEEMVVSLSQELRENIKRFEPRIKITEIDDDYDENGKVRLVVHCELIESGRKIAMALDPFNRSFDIAHEDDDALE